MMRLTVLLLLAVVCSLGRAQPCIASDPDLSSGKSWQAGANFSYLVLFGTNAAIPLYNVQFQYHVKRRWTLDASVGTSRLRRSNGFSSFFEPASDFLSRARFTHWLMIPLNLGTTYHHPPEEGFRNGSYVSSGLSFLTVRSRGRMLGPYIAGGIERPIGGFILNLKFAELTYYHTFERDLKIIDGLMFSVGAGMTF